MRAILSKAIALVAPALALPCVARAQTPLEDIASRVEIRTFQSLTLSDSQFLKGDAGVVSTAGRRDAYTAQEDSADNAWLALGCAR